MAAKKSGRTKGGMDTKHHALCDSQGRPLDLIITPGQVSDYIGARASLSRLPNVRWLHGDRGHDANWFRKALKDRWVRACIPDLKQGRTPVKNDKRRNRSSRDIAVPCSAGRGSRSCSAGSRTGGVLQPAIPAGFLIAALVWIMPRMESAGEVLMIVIVTYVIGLGEMSHVVAGSTELFILVARGELAIGPAIFGGILPALGGNVLGGTGIFAALTYAQLREEI